MMQHEAGEHLREREPPPPKSLRKEQVAMRSARSRSEGRGGIRWGRAYALNVSEQTEMYG